MRHRLLWSALLLGGVTGCGGCGPPSLDQMPEAIAETVCAKYYECCTEAELADNTTFGPNRAKCEESVRSRFESLRSDIREAQERKTLTYNAERLEECLKKYRALSCEEHKSDVTSFIESCETYLEPKAPVGSACEMDEECVDSSCVFPFDANQGTCRALVGEGASCAEAECERGLYCDSATSICTAQKPNGAECFLNRECLTGGCNGADTENGTSGTCGRKGGEGTRCFATTGCASTGSELCAVGALLAFAIWTARRERSIRD